MQLRLMLAAAGREIEAVAVHAATQMAVFEHAVVDERDIVMWAHARERDDTVRFPDDHHRPRHTLHPEPAERVVDFSELAHANAQRHYAEAFSCALTSAAAAGTSPSRATMYA